MIAAHRMAQALGVLCLACAGFGIGYNFCAAVLVRRFFSRAGAPAADFPPITLVKPLHGHELALLANLASFCEQDYPAPVQYLFGVHDHADPALDTIARLRELHPEADITVVVDAQLYGPNRKMSNILNMMPLASYDTLVFADSDVGVDSTYLRRIASELQAPGVGLVTCVYRGLPDPGFWPRMSAKATNYQFLPGVVIGLALGLARPCFGQTIAMRRATLEQIGGFNAFTHHLAEDHAIGEAVRGLGLKVAVPSFAITHACVENTALALVSHELRWARTIRSIDPIGHLGSALTYPFALAVLGCILCGGTAWAWAFVLGALVARLSLKVGVDRTLGQPTRDLWLMPVWDVLSFAIFLTSFVSKRVTWRGARFQVRGDGLMTVVPRPGMQESDAA
ncbi:bacteriohopanetetrol glucosamine biosynthesis glycosyltransferase HpnI [Pararobbsia alpina]|nr:bacteriohopanetetrol glucosamine biosynthesis glycosyltransferase HpnI [Pararobbsia alpina]